MVIFDPFVGFVLCSVLSSNLGVLTGHFFLERLVSLLGVEFRAMSLQRVDMR